MCHSPSDTGAEPYNAVLNFLQLAGNADEWFLLGSVLDVVRKEADAADGFAGEFVMVGPFLHDV